MITTWLTPKLVEYNGGQDFLKQSLEGYEEDYWGYLLGFMSFCPILNLLSAILLICWYITCIRNF